MDPRGTVGRIYKEDHYILLHTKYESSGSCGFGEEDFLCFSHNTPRAGPVWTPPQGHGWQDCGGAVTITMVILRHLLNVPH